MLNYVFIITFNPLSLGRNYNPFIQKLEGEDVTISILKPQREN